VDLTVDGQEIPAIVQVSKQAFVYAFNRETGEPIWPIVERPVPQGSVPTEWYSPTQPFPTRPAPYELQGLTVDDLTQVGNPARIRHQAWPRQSCMEAAARSRQRA